MVDFKYLMDRSEKELVGVHPVVAEKTRELIKKAYDEGIGIAIVQGFRSFAEQDALYAKGRTIKGVAKVTNAKGGQSIHNYGLAVDFCIFDEKKQPDWTVNKDWKRVVEIAEGLGFESGIHWKFYDAPHLQMTFGLTLKQLQAGLRPAGSATPTPVKKSTLLEKGASGSTVKDLQEKLIKVGYKLGEVDSEFGKFTDAAVRKFQKDNKLDVDGIAGKKTLAKLEELVKALDAKKEEVKPEPKQEEKKAEVVKEVPKKVDVKINSLGDKYSFQVKAKKNLTVFDNADLTGKVKTLKKDVIFSVYGFDNDGKVFAVGGGNYVSQAEVEPIPLHIRTGGINPTMEKEFRAFLKENKIEAQLNIVTTGSPSSDLLVAGIELYRVKKWLDGKGWYYNVK